MRRPGHTRRWLHLEAMRRAGEVEAAVFLRDLVWISHKKKRVFSGTSLGGAIVAAVREVAERSLKGSACRGSLARVMEVGSQRSTVSLQFPLSTQSSSPSTLYLCVRFSSFCPWTTLLCPRDSSYSKRLTAVTTLASPLNPSLFRPLRSLRQDAFHRTSFDHDCS